MMHSFSGVRGRVTFSIFAVTAVLYSILGTLGFLSIAEGGRSAIRERIGEVLTQLEDGIRSGTGTLTISTNDGVDAFVVADGSEPTAVPGLIEVTREVAVGGVTLTLVGRSSEARLADSLRSLHRSLWIAIPIAAVVSAAMAGYATRRALRPVGSITALADSIGGTMDGARVPVPDTDDEISHLATTLNAMLDRVDAGRTTQQQFTSDAAHELRTPLMALQGEQELLANGTQPFDTATLDRLSALSARLGERIDDLVLLSTLDEHRPLALASVDLVALVRSEAADLLPDIEIVGTAPNVMVDRVLVARAVRNLLANASRHRHELVRVTIEHNGARVLVHVDDDGPGVPPDAADRIFGRFARLDTSRGSTTGGAGLGLAIVAAVAQAHDGGASVDGSALGGARFTLWFPHHT
jgi:two-component system, OmpR family, sensor kinase